MNNTKDLDQALLEVAEVVKQLRDAGFQLDLFLLISGAAETLYYEKLKNSGQDVEKPKAEVLPFKGKGSTDPGKLH